MKKNIYLITIIILWSSNICFGQITKTKVNATATEKDVIPYDSLENYLGEDAYKYLGQDLYLKGKSEDMRDSGYSGFFLDHNGSSSDPQNIYKPQPKAFLPESNYDDLAEKYFKVLDVFYKDEKRSYEKNITNCFILKLQNKENNDTIYYRYDHKSIFPNFPFIVVGYFEKLKQQYIGKQYIFRNEILGETRDINTGKIITFKLRDKWECVDVTIDDIYYFLNLSLKNSRGEQFLFPINFFNDTSGIFTPKEVQKYTQKFGKVRFDQILKSEAIIGMTKEMCELAWGKPKDINITILKNSTKEQWVYSYNYLYFKNGILYSIQ